MEFENAYEKIQVAKAFADKQYEKFEELRDNCKPGEEVDIEAEGFIYIDIMDTLIFHPWLDETGQVELDDVQAVEAYGLEGVMNFIEDAVRKMEER